ncbi:MAG TPA: hypothetical protein VJR89_38865 [Polyangiales bacterium]|nr:hypothetical protein [Polyangiales bacterium]
MKQTAIRLALVAALAAVAGLATASAHAWTYVPYPSQIGPWGSTVSDITFTLTISAHGRRYTSNRNHTQSTFANGPYQISASARCNGTWITTTGTYQSGSGKLVEQGCSSGQIYSGGYGSVHAMQ